MEGEGTSGVKRSGFVLKIYSLLVYMNKHFAFMYVCESRVCLIPKKVRCRTWDLELKLQLVVSCHMDAENRQVLRKSSRCCPIPCFCHL